MSASPLSLDVRLTSIQELQKSIQDPKYRRDLTPDVLETLLFSHLDHLKDPFKPFAGASQASRTKIVAGQQVDFPGIPSSSSSGASSRCQIEVEEDDVAIVTALSDRLGIDEVESLVLLKRFQKDERGGHHQLQRLGDDQATKAGPLGGRSNGIPHRLAGSTAGALTRSTMNKRMASSKTADETLLSLLTRYFQAESLALVRLLTTIITRAAGANNHDPMEDAIMDPGATTDGISLPIGIKARRLDFICERALSHLAKTHHPTSLIHIIFSSFARSAHQVVPYRQSISSTSNTIAKSWIMHHLKIQTALLESLFQLVYWLPLSACSSDEQSVLVNAETAVGLIQGIFGSTFGAQQANARLIESLDMAEAGESLEKIEALLGLIVLETMGLSGISRGTVVPLDEYPPTDETSGTGNLTLVQSKEAVDQIHTTLGTASIETTRRSPFPLVLLAWSFILSRLHPDILPTSTSEGDFVPVYQTVASIALADEMKALDKWTGLLKGKGFWKDNKGEVGDEYVIGYKDTMNCLMVALCTIIRPQHVQQYNELAAVFTALYGQGPGDTVISVCGDFWRNAANDGRQEVLEWAAFPLFPVTLIELLTAVSGAGSEGSGGVYGEEDLETELLDVSPRETVKQSFEYFSALPEITLKFRDSAVGGIDGYSRELRGQTVTITLERDIVLPCGQVIPSKTRGVLASRSGEDMIVRWAVELSGWRILVSLMQAGLARDEDARRKAEEWSHYIDTSDLARVLSTGLTFVRNVLSVDPALAEGLVEAQDLSASTLRSKKGATVNDLLTIAFALLQQTSVIRQEETWRSAVASATSIVSLLLLQFPQRIWSELRSSGFFTFTRQEALTLRVIIDRDVQSGEFTSTVNALNLIVKLAEHIQLGQFQVDAETVHSRSNTLANTVQFLHQAVSSRYRGWRYISPRQKADISYAISRLYNSVFANPTFLANLTRPDNSLPLGSLNAVLFDKLINTASDFDLAPLLDTITMPLYGSTGSPVYHADRLPLEKALSAALELAYRVLAACYAIGADSELSILSFVSRHAEGHSETDALHVVEAVFQISTSPYLDDATAVTALRFLHMLMIQAQSAGSSFSFMACLRSPQATSDKFVDLLSHGSRSLEVQDAAWQTLRTMTVAQPALARFCLQTEPDTRSKALDIAVEAIKEWEKASKSDARLLSSAIGLLLDLYEHHTDLVEGLGLSTDDRLWTSLSQFTLDIQPGSIVIDRTALTEQAMANEDENVLHRYVDRVFLRAAKGSSIKLLNTVLTIASSSRDSTTMQRSDIKTALKILQSEGGFARLLADSTSSAFDPDLRMEQIALIQTVLPSTLPEMVQIVAPASIRCFGDNYLFDKKGLRAIIQLPIPEKTALMECFQLISINESATVADASVTAAAMDIAQSAVDFAEQADVPATTALAFSAVAGPVSEERRDGSYVMSLQSQRYQLLQALLEASWIGNWTTDEQWIRSTLRPLAAIFKSPVFPLTLPFEQTAAPAYYRPLINTLILYLRYAREISQDNKRDNMALELDDFLHSVVPVVAQLLNDIITMVQSEPNPSALEDLDLTVSALSGLMSHPSAGLLCLAHLDQKGLILRSCEMIPRNSLAIPSLLKSITRLHWTIAQIPEGAEKLSAQGVLRAYTGTPLLQELSIHPESLNDDSELHTIWTTMLSVSRSLLQTLPYTAEYIATEILPFVDSMHRRIQSALAWQLETNSLLVQLAEIHSILEMLLHIARDVEVDIALSKHLFQRYSKSVLSYLLSATNALTRPTVIRMKVMETFGLDPEDMDEKQVGIAAAIDAADDCVMQALLVTSSSAVSLLAEWLSISNAFSRHSATSSSHQPRLPSVSTHMTASRILVEFASCVIDLDPRPKGDLDDSRANLPSFTASWPGVSEKRLRLIRQQALETTLMVTSVQAAGVYLSDIMDEQKEKLAIEKGGNSDKGSTPAKKKNLDRRQGRQDLRDVVDTVKRFRDGDMTPVCNVCYVYLETRCGNLSDI